MDIVDKIAGIKLMIPVSAIRLSTLCAMGPGITIFKMGLAAKKPVLRVFGVSDKVRFKPACSATETS